MKNAQPLPPIIKNMKGLPILCVGDAMLDVYVYGTAARLSPEAPVPVLQASRMSETAGGVANVAANLTALGCSAKLVALSGDDLVRPRLQACLSGVDAVLIPDPSRPTTCKTRYSAGHQQLLRVDEETTTPLTGALEDTFIMAALDAMKGRKALVLSDYGKGALTPRVLQTLIDTAKKAGIPVIVDPKGHDYTRYRGADVVTPNKKELAEATGHRLLVSDADIETAAKTLMASAGIRAVLATRSAEGMSVIEPSGTTHLKTQAREVFDVSGAGDTVVAALAAALAMGLPLSEGAMLANLAAGLVVEKIGTATVQAGELAEALLGHAGPSMPSAGRTMAPVLGWQEARDRIDRWKAAGLRVGFTNGCFDILHQGHVMMLDRCRAHVDKLVLGLNTDASISRLKGASRPVNPASARAAVIAALGSIDAVVMFGDDPEEGDTPLMLMKALRPDVIFKGKDYTADKVVGADFIKSCGGEVVLVDLEDGFSTTATIKKMGNAA